MVRWEGMCGKQLCSVEQLENKLADMRELYNEKMQNTSSFNFELKKDENLSESLNLKEHCLLNFESIFECQVIFYLTLLFFIGKT